MVAWRCLAVLLVLALSHPGSAWAPGFTKKAYDRVLDDGSEMPRRTKLNFAGNVVVTDDSGTGSTKVTVTTGAGSGSPGLTGASSCMAITGASTVYMAAGTCVAAQEVEVEQRVASSMVLTDMSCIASADPGSGETITVTGRTGVCGSLSSTAFVCSLTGGSGRPACTTGANNLSVSGGQCWSLQMTFGSTLATSVNVNCTLERSS